MPVCKHGLGKFCTSYIQSNWGFCNFEIKENSERVFFNGWDKTFGGSGAENIRSVIKTRDGGFLFLTNSQSGISGNKTDAKIGTKDFWVIKTLPSGQIEWAKTYGGSGVEFANIAIESQVSGFLLVGYSSSVISGDKSQASKGGVDYWILKIDKNGSKVWDKTFGGTSADYGKGILPTADGGYIVLGQSDSGMSGDKSQASKGSRDIWMIKIDENGSKTWDKSLGGSGFDYFANAVTTFDGNFVLVGDSLSGQSGDKSEASYSGSRDCWLIKIDQNGSKIWDRTIGSSGSEFARDITNSSDGGFIIAAYSDGSADGNKSEPPLVFKITGFLRLMQMVQCNGI